MAEILGHTLADWEPAPPDEGPPLPKWLAVFWPWYHGSIVVTPPPPPPVGESNLYGAITNKATRQGISAASLMVVMPDGSQMTATVNSDGSYTLEGLPLENNAPWTCRADGYNDVNSTVNLIQGNVRLDIQMTAVGAGGANAAASGSVQDGSGNPVAGAVVTIENVSSQPSDANGNYSIAGLISGNATVVCSVTGFQIYSEQVTLAPGDNTVDIALTPGTPGYTGVVTGTVVNGTNDNPIGGATVTLSLYGTSQSTSDTTDSNGGFSFSQIATGAFVHWACTANGYDNLEGDITVSSSGPTQLNIRLTPASSFYGSAFSYSNVSVSTYSNTNTGDWQAPDFKATIKNGSSQAANHAVKMMWQRVYNGAINYGPAQAYSSPESLELQPGQTFNFEDLFWNPIRGAFDVLMYPQTGVLWQFWLEDENGNKSQTVSSIG